MKTKNFPNVRENKRFGIQFSYILDCIVSDDVEFTTDKERVNYFFECYNSEFNYDANKRRVPNESERIGCYLQGLPSCCTVEYWNDKIEEIGKSWGFCQDYRKAERFVNNWFNTLGFRLLQLREIFNR